MRVCNVLATVATLMLLAPGHAAFAQILGLERVTDGVNAPIFVTHAPADTSRLFIAERAGAIRIFDLTTGTLRTTPFLTMTSVSTSGEGGFLGLAFHPNYFKVGMPGYGKFYVNVTTGSPFTTRIREFEVSNDFNLANPDSLREILSIAQPQMNHNGGWIGFRPNDPYLYIAVGDGGGGDDTGTGHTPGTGNAQDITNNLLGKILRIDVNGDDFPAELARNYAIPPTNPFVGEIGDDEIWAYGLRNPFRASFDRATGDLWIGDVGQSAREEIDFQPASSTGGENYGWRLREGTIATPGDVGGPQPPGNVDPVYDYNRDNDSFGGTVVTGGYVYRGPDPVLQGQYFFCDSRNSLETEDDNYWMLDPADPFGTVANIDAQLTVDVGSAQFPVSFGEDAVGNLYIAYISSGEVYRIRTGALAVTAWRSVRTHAGAGALSIHLNPLAGGDGPAGPGVESRLGGIQRIEVDLGATATLANPSAVSVVGRVTSGGVPGPENLYTPDSVTMADANTLAITFDPGDLPDDACYTITLGAGTFTVPLGGDADALVRALAADATGDGVITLSDALAIRARTGADPASSPGFDVDLSGAIDLTDALPAKSRVDSPPQQALCP